MVETSFFLKPTGLLRAQFFERKSFLPVKKNVKANFFSFIECDKPQRMFIKVQKFSDPYCGSYKAISLGHKGLLKTPVFWKKGYLSSEEKTLAYFSSYYRGL